MYMLIELSAECDLENMLANIRDAIANGAGVALEIKSEVEFWEKRAYLGREVHKLFCELLSL